MFIGGLGTAVPAQRYTQSQCLQAWEASSQFHSLRPRSQQILRKVLNGHSGISTRHLALERLEDALQLEPDVLDARYAKEAPVLARRAAETALANAGVTPDLIDAVIVSSCTGYLCPGLTSYLTGDLGLREDVLGLDLVGQGCGAALPNLFTADALLRSGRCACVLSVCVEVCSAAFYLDNDPGVLISSCLFGDGAAAAILTESPSARRKVRWKVASSVCRPEGRDLLRFERRGGLLRNILTREVPAAAAAEAARVLERTLARAGVDRSQITGWIFHPGGRDVLEALCERLTLAEEDLRWSAAILSAYGNLSSPSVLFVLEAALQDAAPSGYWWMSAFGAGFSCHGALLEVE